MIVGKARGRRGLECCREIETACRQGGLQPVVLAMNLVVKVASDQILFESIVWRAGYAAGGGRGRILQSPLCSVSRRRNLVPLRERTHTGILGGWLAHLSRSIEFKRNIFFGYWDTKMGCNLRVNRLHARRLLLHISIILFRYLPE